MEHRGTYDYADWRRMQQAKQEAPKEESDSESDSGSESGPATAKGTHTYIPVKNTYQPAFAPPYIFPPVQPIQVIAFGRVPHLISGRFTH